MKILILFVTVYNYGQIEKDSFLSKWDEMTKTSFKESIELVKNHEKFYILGQSEPCCYQNRISFITFLNSKEIIKKDWEEYFVIETFFSGELSVIQNYIIHKTKDKYFELILIENTSGIWTISKKINISLSEQIQQYFERTSLLDGKNIGNVILSKFKNGKVEFSEYYILGTIKEPLPFIRVFGKYIYSKKEKKFILDPLQEKYQHD